MPSTASSTSIETTIRETLELFHRPGDVVEVRIIGLEHSSKFMAGGYFDDFDKAAEAALHWDEKRKARGVYFVMNRCKPALLARSANHITEYLKPVTADHDIERRRWLLIDLDATRPAGIGSTEEELQASIQQAEQVRDWLAERLWPQPVEALSGNGKHLLYPIDLPNDDESRKLVEGVLKALSNQFSTPQVEIDLVVGNAARITKLYGTAVRKGDSTADRPHRTSGITYVPDGMPDACSPVPLERLQEVAALVQTEPAKERPDSAQHSNGRSRLDVPRWLAARGVQFVEKGDNGRAVYEIDCPFNSEHIGEANITQFESGAVSAGCFHNGCSGKKWQDFKEAIGKPDGDHYDPPLSGKGKQAGGSKQSALSSDSGGFTGSRVMLVTGTTIISKRAEWMIPGRIPVAGTTLFYGDGDVGKTTVYCDLVARQTTGGEFLGNRLETKDALIVATEDSWEHTMRPRLDAAGADPARWHRMTETEVINSEGERETVRIDLINHARLIEDAIEELQAAGHPVGMLIIDPIGEHTQGDQHRDNEVRRLTSILGGIATKFSLSVILILHEGKDKNRDAKHRFLGSVAYRNSARSAFWFVEDPDDEDRRLIFHTKNNLGPKSAPLAYRLVSAGDVARVEWDETQTVYSAEEVAKRQRDKSSGGKLSQAKAAFLAALPGTNWRFINDVDEELLASGVAKATLGRAKTDLKKQKRIQYRKDQQQQWMVAANTAAPETDEEVGLF